MFIEVSDGIYVDREKIEGLEAVNDLKTLIYTASRTYPATLPIKALKQLLEASNEGAAEKLLTKILQTQAQARP